MQLTSLKPIDSLSTGLLTILTLAHISTYHSEEKSYSVLFAQSFGRLSGLASCDLTARPKSHMHKCVHIIKDEIK